MSDINVPLPGESPQIVWMHIPPDGEPMRCLADKIGYATGLGYVQCDPPGTLPKPKANVITPDETAADRMEREQREFEEKAATVHTYLESIGVTRSPNIACPDCGGSGLCPKGEVAPCWSCYPEAREAAEAAATVVVPEGDDEVPLGGGSDNGGAIVGAPADVTVTTSGSATTDAPKSCNATGCKGLCGICPPPKRVTVRQGRELNRNRKALGLDALKIVDGVVKGGA